ECRRAILSGLFLEFAGLFFRSAQLLKTGGSHPGRKGKELGPLLSFVQEHFRESWSLDELARRFFFHPTYLSRVFRKNTGYTLPEYVNELRLREAGKLLKSTGKSILDVSLACGFDQLSWFNRSFKKAFGQSPGAFRKKPEGMGNG
ncbi:MAG: helix-turn-helix transcriptional regulator, partial [Spirochaetia bacterium]|nr:helix-turn-helix transcriptional regulator [Spirochaetia bacterium]